MADKIKIRDVGLREIYDSYMGILRISPDTEYNDDITEALTNGTDIQISDSDGNGLSLILSGKSKKTTIKPGDIEVNLVSVVSKVKDILFACKSANIRSTLYLGRPIGDNEGANIVTVSEIDDLHKGTADVLLYPIDSPYNNRYWNDLGKKVTHAELDNFPGDDYDEKLENFLFNQAPEFYSGLESHFVKVNGKTVYITNVNDQLIPVLYNKSCVLGNRKDATGKLNEQLKTKYITNTDYGYKSFSTYANIRIDNSYITRLSYFNLDKMIWDGIGEVTSGNIRHNSPGRYEELGAGANINLKRDLFHIDPQKKDDYTIVSSENNVRAYSLIDTAPLLATSVEPGLIIYNAMPMKKFAYNALRQIACNIRQGLSVSNVNATNVNGIFKNMLTAAGTGEKTNAIRLVKNFALCDGQNIKGSRFNNHPHLDFKNEMLSDLMTGSPKTNTIYSCITKTLNLLDWHSTSGRFLRGQMWSPCETSAEEEPVTRIFNESTYGNISDGDNRQIEVIQLDSSFNPYAVSKNFVDCNLPHMVNYDSRICRTTHTHYMFNGISGQHCEPITATTTRRIPLFNRSSQVTTQTSEIVISAQVLGRTAVDGIPGWLTGNQRRTINLTYPSIEAVPWYNESANMARLNTVQVLSSPTNRAITTIGAKIRNELDAAKPISVIGGGGTDAGCTLLHENGYDTRSGSNGKLQKHSQKYHYSRDVVGGYEIQAAAHSAGEKWGDRDDQVYVELGLSSLPFENRERLGQGDVLIKAGQDQEYKKNRKIGEKDVNVNINVPTPPSLNFLPLLRI